MNTTKLFVVTKTEAGYNWSRKVWEKYFLANNLETVKTIVIHRYGPLDSYFYNEEETHITIKETEVEAVDPLPEIQEDDDDD